MDDDGPIEISVLTRITGIPATEWDACACPEAATGGRPDDPFTPLLADRPRHAVILSSRGGAGFEPGGELAHLNHLEPGLSTALEFIGITRIHRIAVEHQEEGGERLAASVREAEQRVEVLVSRLVDLQHEKMAVDYA